MTVRLLSRIVPFSVTSWGRTAQRNKAVGGVANSWHLDYMAVDVVLDDVSDLNRLRQYCAALSLEVIAGEGHWHIEPVGPRRLTPL